MVNHEPVLLDEVIHILDPNRGESVLDVTLGLGGHARAFLERIGSDGRFMGLDADEENLNNACVALRDAPTCHGEEDPSIQFQDDIRLLHMNFREFFANPNTKPEPEFDIIFADLGLSSPHLDDPERGFSFRHDAPLDLRFDRSQGETGAQLINRASEAELADILFEYGEIKSSRKIARALKEQKIQNTFDVVRCTEEAVGKFAKSILPQVFQALRIEVNDELGSLKILLEEGPKILKPGGRMGVISFHSLEDRMVKQMFKALCTADKDPVTGADVSEPEFELLTKKPICPSDKEIERNPRSRSAKMRVIRKLGTRS